MSDYRNQRDQLSVVDGLNMKGQKVVIPQALRAGKLQSVHIGHMCIDKCPQKASDTMFWPKM